MRNAIAAGALAGIVASLLYVAWEHGHAEAGASEQTTAPLYADGNAAISKVCLSADWLPAPHDTVCWFNTGCPTEALPRPVVSAGSVCGTDAPMTNPVYPVTFEGWGGLWAPMLQEGEPEWFGYPDWRWYEGDCIPHVYPEHGAFCAEHGGCEAQSCAGCGPHELRIDGPCLLLDGLLPRVEFDHP